MAAQNSTSLAWLWVRPAVAPLRSIQASARRLASNSTGRVTSANKVDAENKATPSQSTNKLWPAVARPMPTMMTHGASWLPRLTTGTSPERNASIGYRVACWTACPHSCAATAAAATLRLAKTGSLRFTVLCAGW